MIREALERETSFKVCAEATDGTDAVSKAKELEPDLVILDVRMPGLNGVEVAGILRYALPRIRIVLVTMFAEDFASDFTSLFRIDAVVSKTNGLADLTAHVTSLLANPHPAVATSGGTLNRCLGNSTVRQESERLKQSESLMRDRNALRFWL